MSKEPVTRQKPTIVFGVNSMFAVRHLLTDSLSFIRAKGYEAVVVTPRPARQEDELAPDSCPGVQFRFVSIHREISPFSDLLALWQLCSILRSLRPSITNMSTPKMAFLGGLAAWLTGVPHRIYTLRGLRYETARSWKRAVLMACRER